MSHTVNYSYMSSSLFLSDSILRWNFIFDIHTQSVSYYSSLLRKKVFGYIQSCMHCMNIMVKSNYGLSILRVITWKVKLDNGLLDITQVRKSPNYSTHSPHGWSVSHKAVSPYCLKSFQFNTWLYVKRLWPGWLLGSQNNLFAILRQDRF